MIRARFYLGTRAFKAAIATRSHVVDVTGERFLTRCARIAAVLDAHGIEGATIQPAVGVWNTAAEPSVTVECLLSGPCTGLVTKVAEALRGAFDQDSVLWTLDEVQSSGSADR